MIRNWILNVGPTAPSAIESDVLASYEDEKRAKKLQRTNRYTDAMKIATGLADPKERESAIEAADALRAERDYNEETDRQVSAAAKAARAIADALGVASVRVTLQGRHDEDARDDSINHRIAVFVDQAEEG